MRRLLLSLLLTAPALGQGYVPPGGVKAQDEGSTLGQALTYNFTGTGVTCTWLAPVVTCNVPGNAVDGSGSANKVTKWTDGDSLGDSTITDDGSTVTLTTPLRAASGAVGGPGISFSGAATTGFFLNSGLMRVSVVGTETAAFLGSGEFRLQGSASAISWAGDVYLARGAANVLAQRNSTNAQTMQWFGTFTDASNYTRAAVNTTSTTVTFAAETAGTGADDIDVTLSPAGTGSVTVPTQKSLCLQDSAGGDEYCIQSEATAPAGTTQLALNIDPATCTGDGNGGALTVDGSNNIVCSADAGGAGSGLPDAEVRIRVSYGGF